MAWLLLIRVPTTTGGFLRDLIKDSSPGDGPRRSCRIRYKPQELQLSATGIAQEEISAKDFSQELHGALEESVSEVSLSVVQNRSGSDETFDSSDSPSDGVSAQSEVLQDLCLCRRSYRRFG